MLFDRVSINILFPLAKVGKIPFISAPNNSFLPHIKAFCPCLDSINPFFCKASLSVVCLHHKTKEDGSINSYTLLEPVILL